MPFPGTGRLGSTTAEAGMSPSAFNTEFDTVDSDEGSPLPLLDFMKEAQDAASESLRTGAAESQGLAPPTNHQQPSQSSNGSYHDSSSDSSFSKRTESTDLTTQTAFTGDMMMTDDPDPKVDFNVEDYINTDDDSFAFDGTVNPSSIEGIFRMDEKPVDVVRFDFNSVTSTPSPFTTSAVDVTSPRMSIAQQSAPLKTSASGRKAPAAGHAKGLSQHSLSQSMDALKTGGSREVSPASNMAFSQDSSPSALLSNTPSPTAILDFMNGSGIGSLDPAAFSGFNFSGTMPQNALQHFGTNQAFSNAQAPAGNAFMNLSLFQQPSFGQTPVPCRLRIDPTPLKSRVETQIPIKLIMSPLPPGIKRLHLPRHTISKPKLLAKPLVERSPDMLELYTVLVCTSAMLNADVQKKALARAANSHFGELLEDSSDDEGNKPSNGGEVHICAGCVIRERKRAARKKSRKLDEEESWLQDERKRVIVFNTHEVKDWLAQSPPTPASKPREPEFSIDTPMRIACYCRHHAEKQGFRVIFTVKDYQDRLVAQAMSQSIMITDDHKTHLPSTGPAASNSQELLPATTPTAPTENKPQSPDNSIISIRGSPSTSDLPTLQTSLSVPFQHSAAAGQTSQFGAQSNARNLSRPPSPSPLCGPSNKKRKASNSAKVPSGLAMTRLETEASPSLSQPSSAQVSATSPFSPMFSAGPSDAMFGQASASGTVGPNSFNAGPTSPNGNEQVLFGASRSASMDNLAMTQLYSAPTSAHASRAPSPSGLRHNNVALQQPGQPFAPSLPNGMSFTQMGLGQARPPSSVIHKIIPNEGPRSGGIEVTILGSGFSLGLEVMFGDQKATTTTYWGESSLVCLVPPSPIAGAVLVTLRQNGVQASQPFSTLTKQAPIFKYVDDEESQLMRTALSVLGHKMTGKLEDVRDVARRIIGDGSSSWGPSSSSAGSTGGGNYTGFSLNMDFESQLLKVLELIDLDDSTHKVKLNLQRRTGQTMLHLACAMGLHRFVAGLLARGANPDVRDKGGYTPMHLAAVNNHTVIVRRLIYAGADPTIRTLSGLTPSELAQSREVLRAIRKVERHARSRSGGSIHSRASSATSLRSLWEPTPNALTTQEYATDESETSEESLEYSSEASTSDNEGIEGDSFLRMRRSSAVSGTATVVPGPRDPEAQAGPASPTAAMAAFREQCAAQFQQFQQAMALHLQNLPHFPYLPQIPTLPGMAPFADYQAYLNSGPVLERISSLVPNIGGSRPGSVDDQQPQGKEMGSKWWDLSSFRNTGAPPAYEDIFPHEDLDKKQASAAQAAAEAEADIKCAALYDQTSVTAEGASTSVPPQLPALLEIGRKNAITKEQQENLRRAHAEKLKRLSTDKKLFFVWIPLLLVMLCCMLYSQFPRIFYAATIPFPSFTGERMVEVV